MIGILEEAIKSSNSLMEKTDFDGFLPLFVICMDHMINLKDMSLGSLQSFLFNFAILTPGNFSEFYIILKKHLENIDGPDVNDLFHKLYEYALNKDTKLFKKGLEEFRKIMKPFHFFFDFVICVFSVNARIQGFYNFIGFIF